MGTIVTSEAKCRDCYKCIRYCPVKAIGINEEQAWVVEEKCILCGKCVEVCPQNAKSTVSYLSEFTDYLAEESQVVVSLAPSYLAATPYSTPWKLVAGLKELGVDLVEETALGAEIISREYQRFFKNKSHEPLISSCCPTIVRLVERYYPELVDSVAPLISPMIAHARKIKQERGKDTRVVFIGPCFSKKDEPDWQDKDNPVDLVLDFQEIINYFEKSGINPEMLEDRYPDLPSKMARLYPLEGGILEVSGIDNRVGEVISVSGVDEAMEVFEDMVKGLINPRFVEALACKGGCIGGPAMANDLGIATRRQRISEFMNKLPDFFQETEEVPSGRVEDSEIKFPLTKEHSPDRFKSETPSEAEIREILALTGKVTPEDETNCGGCGYPSCREKAIAVYQGLAKPEMCVPYMREKAESLSHAVVDSSLNGIIIVDEDMIIQEFNPAANRMFNRKGIKSKGKPLKTFIDPADYEYVRDNQEMIVNKFKEYEQYGLITRENIYPLEKYGVVIAIITDVTEEEKRKAEVDKMKEEALNRASRVIREQMKVAQEIAGLLGESTAETKATLLELIEIMNTKEARVIGDQS